MIKNINITNISYYTNNETKKLKIKENPTKLNSINSTRDNYNTNKLNTTLTTTLNETFISKNNQKRVITTVTPKNIQVKLIKKIL